MKTNFPVCPKMAAKGVKPPLNKEDEIGRKWDRCVTDVILKLGGGLAIGGVVSLFFCRRRSWPIFLVSGFAVGMAYSNCERDLNLTISSPAKSSGAVIGTSTS